MKKIAIRVCTALLLVLLAVSAIHYVDIGQWKGYVMLFGYVELFVLFISAIICVYGNKIVRMSSCALLGVMQLFPMVSAFAFAGTYTKYGVFHAVAVAICVVLIFFISREKAWE